MRGAEPPKNVRTVLRLLEQRLDYPWTIEELAHATQTPPATLRRHFQEAMKTSIKRHQTHLRLRAASRLLRLDDRTTLAEIAESCGFYDEFHFSKVFKKHLGTSPSAYRESKNG